MAFVTIDQGLKQTIDYSNLTPCWFCFKNAYLALLLMCKNTWAHTFSFIKLYAWDLMKRILYAAPLFRYWNSSTYIRISTVYQTDIQKSAEMCSLLNLCLTVVVLMTAKWKGSIMTIDQAAAQPASPVSHVGNGDRFVCNCLSDCRPPGEWTCVFVFSFVCYCLHVWPHWVIHYSLSKKPISFTSAWEILTFPWMAS